MLIYYLNVNYSLTNNIFKLMFKLIIVLTKNYKLYYYGKL